jgi:hypothetical protein
MDDYLPHTESSRIAEPTPQPLHVTWTSVGVHARISERSGRDHMDCISGMQRDCVRSTVEISVEPQYAQCSTGEEVGGCVSRGLPNSSSLSHGNLWAVHEVTSSEGNVLTKEPVMTTNQYLQPQVRLHCMRSLSSHRKHTTPPLRRSGK